MVQILLLLMTLCLAFCQVSPPCHPIPALPNHTGEGDLPPSTRTERGETCVRITFCPMLQDQSAFSSSGIMADFVVQYDVVMEDIIGDVKVREPGERKEHGLWRHTGLHNNLAPTSCSFGSPWQSVRTSECEQDV